ncbi:uncharacterized protein [Oscarella lobularis]|uniref:uncharacterized protein n=1 Tax=Oscarella lobularis TaxID=121494 RepID=UPI00331430C3
MFWRRRGSRSEKKEDKYRRQLDESLSRREQRREIEIDDDDDDEVELDDDLVALPKPVLTEVVADFPPRVAAAELKGFESQLTVKEGDRVRVLYRRSSTWSIDWVYAAAATGDGEGYIPAHYCRAYAPAHAVRRYDDEKKEREATTTTTTVTKPEISLTKRRDVVSTRVDAKKGDRVEVVDNFCAAKSAQLSVKQGEQLTVVAEEKDHLYGWPLVRNEAGKVGCVPVGHLRIVSRAVRRVNVPLVKWSKPEEEEKRAGVELRSTVRSKLKMWVRTQQRRDALNRKRGSVESGSSSNVSLV